MPLHPFEPPRGTLETLHIDSQALAGNLLGDPTRRRVAIYLPEGYHDTDADYPLFVDLAGFTSSGLKHLAWQAFNTTLPQRIDALVQRGDMGPVILALPDAFTSLGGNQYINSAAMGNWADFLTQEMIPAIEARFRVRAGREHRAVFGKSSGGYAALVHGMRYPEFWGAIASHAGDVGFEWVYKSDFPRALTALARYQHDVEAFLDNVYTSKRVAGSDFHTLMTLAMAATYIPDPEAPKGIRLPVDPHTCEIDEERWSAWLAHDPLHIIDEPEAQSALRTLSGIFIDCGDRDQYHIQYGTRVLVRKLESYGIHHTYEAFDGTHSGIDYRLDTSLPYLYRALSSS